MIQLTIKQIATNYLHVSYNPFMEVGNFSCYFLYIFQRTQDYSYFENEGVRTWHTSIYKKQIVQTDAIWIILIWLHLLFFLGNDVIKKKHTWKHLLWRREFITNCDDSAQKISALHSSFEQHPFCCITMAKVTFLMDKLVWKKK